MFRIEIGEQMMSSENDIPVNIIQLVMQITPEQSLDNDFGILLRRIIDILQIR